MVFYSDLNNNILIIFMVFSSIREDIVYFIDSSDTSSSDFEQFSLH